MSAFKLENYNHLRGLINLEAFTKKLFFIIGARFENRKRDEKSKNYPFSLFYLSINLDKLGLIDSNLNKSILEKIASRVSNSIRDLDSFTFFGKNNFGLLLHGTQNEKSILEFYHRLKNIIEEPLEINEIVYTIHSNMGIVIPTKQYESAENFIALGKKALRHAQEKNLDFYVLIDDDVNLKNNTASHYTNLLQESLLGKTFTLHFQPIINLNDHSITSCEALLRMKHDTNFTPFELIKVAEKSGQISQIGRFVLKEACIFSKKLEENGIDDCEIKINISPYELHQANFFSDIQNIISEMNINQGRIGIELTENVFINYDQNLKKNLTNLRDMGIKISLDDFGTGYSNLSNLKKLPLDAVKIDRSFLTEAITSEKDAAFAASIIVLGHTLSLKVIAEGVESDEQIKFLKNFECDYGQGFAFSPALNAQEFQDYYIKARKGVGNATHV